MSVLDLLKTAGQAGKRYGVPWFIGARAGNALGAGAGYMLAGEDASATERAAAMALGAAMGGPPGALTLAGPRIAGDVMAALRARAPLKDAGVLGQLMARAAPEAPTPLMGAMTPEGPTRRWQAALRESEDGPVFTGLDHRDAIENVTDPATRARLDAIYSQTEENPLLVGFLSDGKFMSRADTLASMRAARKPNDIQPEGILAEVRRNVPARKLINDPRLSPDEGYAASRALEGLPPRLIAEEMNTSPESVRVLLSRARKKAPDLEIARAKTGYPPSEITDEVIVALRDRLKALGSVNARGGVNTLIGERFGMTPNAVAQRIARYNRNRALKAVAPIAAGGGGAGVLGEIYRRRVGAPA